MISLLSIMHVLRQTLSTGSPAGRRSPRYQTGALLSHLKGAVAKLNLCEASILYGVLKGQK